MNATKIIFALSLTLPLGLACGAPTEEVATSESNILITSPTCNEVFDFALNPPNLFYTRALFSYQNISFAAQARDAISPIRNGLRFYATSSYDIDAMGQNVESVDVRLLKQYSVPNRLQPPQQVASKLSVDIDIGNTSIAFDVIPTSCEFVGYGAVVYYKSSSGRVATLSFYYESLVGG